MEEILQTTPGDTNVDELVAFDDFLTLSANFGQRGTWAQGDFNGDGEVGFADFLQLSGNFGFGAFAAALDEDDLARLGSEHSNDRRGRRPSVLPPEFLLR